MRRLKKAVLPVLNVYIIFSRKKIGISVVFFWRELEEPKLLPKILFKGKVINKTNRTRS